MPRAGLSYGLLTSQNQGGGNKKQGLPPTVGLGHFSMKVIQQRGGYCPCPLINGGGGNNCALKVVNGGTFSTQVQLEKLRGCTKINGTLNISEFIGQPDFSVFDCLEEITGDFLIGIGQQGGGNYIPISNTLTFIAGFNKLKTIGGYFNIYENNALKTVAGFNKLKSIGGYFNIDANPALKTIAEFPSLETIGGDFFISRNAALETIAGFPKLETISGTFRIENNAALTAITDFSTLTTIGRELLISFNGATVNTTAPNYISTTVSGFTSLTTINGVYEDTDGAAIIAGFDETHITQIIAATNAQIGTAVPVGKTYDNRVYTFIEVDGGTFTTNAELARLYGCTKINGDLRITGFVGQPDFSVFDALKEISGIIIISYNPDLITLSGFDNLLTAGTVGIDGGISVNNNPALISISGFSSLTTMVGALEIENNNALKTMAGFSSLQMTIKIESAIQAEIKIISNAALETIPEFNNLTTIEGNLRIEDNAALKTITGFRSLQDIESLGIRNNAALTALPEFPSLQDIDFNFEISGNAVLTAVTGFTGFTTVGDLFINANAALKTISGFTGLSTMNGVLSIADNGVNLTANSNNVVTTVSGFTSLTEIIGSGDDGVAATIQGVSEAKKTQISTALDTIIEAAVGDNGDYVKENVYFSPPV